MSIKPLTPLGLAFSFAVLLAGWASAANGLVSSSAQSGGFAGTVQHHAMSTQSSKKASHSSHKASAKHGGSTTVSDSLGQHGGPVARFHDGCALPSGVTLSGNWTHGDYVSAWAKSGDHAGLQAADHSQCGKPMRSSKHIKGSGTTRSHGNGRGKHGDGGAEHSSGKASHGHRHGGG